MKRTYFLGRNRALLVTSAIAAVLGGPAFAQQSDAQSSGEDTQTLDKVIVVGQRAMMESAVNMQRNSDTVESVLTKDGVGQFPDQNVAESLRRLPGINILDDQGEGRFVSVRFAVLTRR